MENINNLLNISESIDESTLASHKIMTHCTDDGRMILKSDLRDTTAPLSLIRLVCNGIVIDTIDNKIVSLPMPIHYSYNNINKHKFKKLYEQNLYKVNYAVDGSTVTLYTFEGHVCISTSNSVDVTGISIKDCPPMDRLLMESLPDEFKKETGIRYAPGGLIWDLPENICITLGFHNYLMHYGNYPNSAWLIGVKDRITGEIITSKNNYGLKTNEVVRLKMTYEEILDSVNESFQKSHHESNFGYIFESINPEITQELSRVFIPSNYYNDLELMYMLTGIKNNRIRDDEVILKLILESNSKINNIKMVNQKLYTIINHYEINLNALIENIYNDFVDGTYHSEFSSNIITKIKREEPDVSVDSEEIIKKLINDHVYDVQNVKTFLKMFCPKRV